jgi:heme-degrading monooxygenase HmoA
MPLFLLAAFRSAQQAKAAPGNVAVAVLNDEHRTFWTCSAWSDDDAMRSYMSRDPHRSVMRKLAHWCDEASVVHWEQASRELPPWPVVHERMQYQGRPSRVEHPSESHLAFRVPAPDLSRAKPVRLK